MVLAEFFGRFGCGGDRKSVEDVQLPLFRSWGEKLYVSLHGRGDH